MKDRRYGNWADLPPELISSVLLRLDTISLLENAQKVCRSWRGVCRDPSMWRKIDMHNLENFRRLGYGSDIMCRHAVDRSQGGLLEIDIWYFVTDELLSYIADRSSNLRSLRLVMCNGITNTGLVETVVKLPSLEYLEVSDSVPSGEFLKVAGESCPNLKTLKLNYTRDHSFDDDDDDAMAIAESMPELRDLQICGNGLTDKGLNAILDGCPHLKRLDLRHCFNVELVGDLRKRVYERIDNLRHPDDFLADCSFDHLSGQSFAVEEEGVVEVELDSDDDYSYHSDEYIYDMSDDVDNHPDTYDD